MNSEGQKPWENSLTIAWICQKRVIKKYGGCQLVTGFRCHPYFVSHVTNSGQLIGGRQTHLVDLCSLILGGGWDCHWCLILYNYSRLLEEEGRVENDDVAGLYWGRRNKGTKKSEIWAKLWALIWKNIGLLHKSMWIVTYNIYHY